MPRKRRSKRKALRIDALDGLRAIAIIAVVLYHLGVPWLPSGHMGVVMFLVLAGYLASSTVLRTIRREGSVSLPRLWLKRVGRVWPSMFVMIVFVVALCVAFNHILLTKLRPDLLPSLLLANNLGAILRGASYFDNLGGTSPLTHLWYLGVDLQFFVVWTAIVAFLCPEGRSSRIARRIALVLAAVSAVLMGVLYDPNADPTRVYYGPDTRAFAPLLGAWLGLAWPLGGRPVRLTASRLTVRSIPLAIVSPVALVGLLAIMALVPDVSPFLYRGGMLLVAILSVLVLAGALDRRSAFSQVLSLKPLVWLGTRSYALYLWHFPLFQLFKVTNKDTSLPLVVLAVAVSLLLSELTVRLIERPLSNRLLPLVFSGALLEQDGPVHYAAYAPAALTIVALASGITGLIVIPNETAVPEGAIQSTGVGAAEAMDVSDRLDKQNTDDEKESTSSTSDSSKDAKSGTEKEPTSGMAADTKSGTSNKDGKTSQDSDDLPTGSITLKPGKSIANDGKFSPVIIADSVAGDAEWYFDDHVLDCLLDSYVGRRPDQAISVLQGYIDQGVVGDIVVLDTFSNNPATDADMRALIEACGKRHVYIVNVSIPEVEEAQINETIDRFVAEYDNVTLIDWHSLCEGHESEWLYADETHLTPEGQPVYVDMITNAIAADYVAEGGEVVASE